MCLYLSTVLHMQTMTLPSPEKLLMVYEDAKHIEDVARQEMESRHHEHVELETPKLVAVLLQKALKAATDGKYSYFHEISDHKLQSSVLSQLHDMGYRVTGIVKNPTARGSGIRLDIGPVKETPRTQRSWWRLGF